MAKSLFDKTYIGKMKLKNRIFMSPMGTTGEADGAYCNEGIDYFEERAKGGAGLIITGANVVSTKYEPRPCTELSDFHHVERLNMLIERCHAYGAKVCVQLSPGLGRQQFTDPFTPPYSAGSVGAFWFPNLICKPFSKEDIHYLVEKVGYSASLAVNAGADCVELHAYGGYLLDQFHSVQWNNRTDEYGGTLENRMRFTLECIEAIKKNVPDTMPVLVKFTPHQRVEGFRTIDEGIEMAKILEKAGVDALHVDTGCYEEWFQAITTVYSKEGYKLDVQKAIKDIVSVPVLGDGNLKDPEVAKKAVEDGILDYVGLAHQMLADQYWPKKVKAHHEEDIAPCVGCNECLLAGFSGKHYYCAVNPLCYAEKAYALPLPNGQKRNVLVIGGGPAGMMAAITAKRRGFDVDLYEKEDKLGGTLWPAGGPDFKADVLKLIKYLETQCQKLGVNIHLNTAITKDNIQLNCIDSLGNIVSTDEYLLPTYETMYQSGAEELTAAIEEISSTVEPMKNVDNWSNYNRIAARDYARKWWGPYTSNYNPAYNNYVGKGGDCANFVSQCVYAGGVPIHGGWSPDSVAWINAASLKNNMLQYGYATKEDAWETNAGNFAYTTAGQGHIVLVTLNDTVTLAYTAHTTNCKDQPFTQANINGGYSFYIIKNF